MIVFDDPAVACIRRLRVLLPGVKIADRVPAQRPPEFVWVVSDGGPRRQGYAEQRVRVNVFAPNDSRAIEIATAVDGLMCDAVPDGEPICRVTRSTGPVDVADESTAARRYALYEVVMHGRNAA